MPRGIRWLTSLTKYLLTGVRVAHRRATFIQINNQAGPVCPDMYRRFCVERVLRVLWTVGLLAVAAPAAAQVAPGSLTGTVLDEHGGGIPGASVDVTCGATMKHAVTSATGAFKIDGLPAGRCSVAAEAEAFSRVTRGASVPSDRLAVVLAVRGLVSDVMVTPSRGNRETAFDSPQASSAVSREEGSSRVPSRCSRRGCAKSQAFSYNRRPPPRRP